MHQYVLRVDQLENCFSKKNLGEWHEHSACPHSKKSQSYSGLHWERGDPSPLLSGGEASPGVHCSGLPSTREAWSYCRESSGGPLG